MSIVIWHNPRCSKSRLTLEMLQEKGLNPDVRLYLDDIPTAAEIDHILTLLGREPKEFMRVKEAEFSEQNLGDVDDRAALIDAMVATPKLIERPVVINGDKAAIGRPIEDVLAIL